MTCQNRLRKLAMDLAVPMTWLSWLTGLVLASATIAFSAIMIGDSLGFMPIFTSALHCIHIENDAAEQAYCQYFVKDEFYNELLYEPYRLYPHFGIEEDDNYWYDTVSKQMYFDLSICYIVAASCSVIFWILIAQWMLRPETKKTIGNDHPEYSNNSRSRRRYFHNESREKRILFYTGILGGLVSFLNFFALRIARSDGAIQLDWVLSDDLIEGVTRTELKEFVDQANQNPWTIWYSENDIDYYVGDTISFKVSSFDSRKVYNISAMILTIFQLLLLILYFFWSYFKLSGNGANEIIDTTDAERQSSYSSDKEEEEEYERKKSRHRRRTSWAVELDDETIERNGAEPLETKPPKPLLNDHPKRVDNAHMSWKKNIDLIPNE